MSDAPSTEALFTPLRKTIDTLWASLAPNGKPTAQTRIVFVSSAHREGTTTIAACAAIGLAQHLREKVLLIETNYHTPGLAAAFKRTPSPGLTELINGSARLEEALVETDVPGLSILPAGAGREPSRGAFASEDAVRLLDRASAGQTYVLVDAPPVLLYPESRLLLWQMDAAVPVFRTGKTHKDTAEKVIRTIASSGVRIAGAVLNRFRPDMPAWVSGRDYA